MHSVCARIMLINENEKSMKTKFFLFLVFSVSNFIYASDENSGPLASAAYLDNRGNNWQSVEIDSDEKLKRLVQETNDFIDDFDTKWNTVSGMLIGTFTGFGTALATALTLREILPPAVSVFLGVGSMAVQMGIGAYIGYRCKNQKKGSLL
jgi:hypothetical protein